MRRRHTHLVLLAALAAFLPLPPSVHADGLKISAVTVGIGGRYRPGGWVPVTVTAVNAGAGAVPGQVQLSEDGPGGAMFARPVTVTAGPAPQPFTLDARGLDPGREDILVRIASGAARGDGAVLAEANSFSATGRSLFSGTPVSDRDLLLVGFSAANSSGFASLNGQKWGLMHTAGGVTVDSGSQGLLRGGLFHPPGAPPGLFRPAYQSGASVQVAAAGAADLPDRPAAYAGVDAVLLRADAPLDALSEAQADSLKAWVAAGGHLIVCGGADPALFSNTFFAGLLPASVAPGAGTTLALTPKPLPGVRTLAAASGRPIVVAGPYGAGQVTLLAFDPAAQSAGAGPVLWRAVFAAGPSSLLPVVTAREEGGAGGGFNSYGPQPQLAGAVMRAPALDVPGADVVGLFLFAYVLILVPVNYLVLKRLDKKEWAWATIPALVVLFAAGTYAVGYAAKGSRVFVNRAALLETSAGQRQAGLYAAVGLFSPRRASYDLIVPDPNALAAVPALPNQGFNYGRRSQSAADGYGQARVVEGGAGAQVQDAAVNMWAMRAFDTQTTVDLGGAVTATVSASVGISRVTLTNRTPHTLRDCQVLAHGVWAGVGDLAPGGSQTASVVPNTVGASGWGNSSLLNIRDAAAAQDPSADVRQRMRAGLADFARGLGAPNGGQYGYGGGFSPPAVFTPRPGEAILLGWCDDPALAGPPVRVDGHPVTENDVTLVVVHVPLR